MIKHVILDPGHGGVDPSTGRYTTAGKRSPVWPDGSVYYEGQGNRQIALLAAQLLVAKGVRVYYTVEPNDHRDISLRERCQRVNRIHQMHSDAILISIHSNGVSIPQANGYEVYTSPGQTKSDEIASKWFKAHGAAFPGLKGRKSLIDGDVDKEARFRMLVDTTCPAILIETMFHTNYQECKILQSRDGVKKIAQAIVKTCTQ